MRFFKGELVCRKENNKILAKITGRLGAVKKELSIAKLKAHVKYGLLYQNEQGQWRIADNQDTARIPTGLYTYVCTEMGFIRLEPLVQGETKHLVLADHAEKIRYAGWIKFKEDGSGEIEYWNNDSGGYKPSPHQCQQAGLPLELFQNESESPRSREIDAKIFCLDAHKQAIQAEAARTILHTYKQYKACKQVDTFQRLRNKERLKVIANNAEPRDDEISKQAIRVTCA